MQYVFMLIMRQNISAPAIYAAQGSDTALWETINLLNNYFPGTDDVLVLEEEIFVTQVATVSSYESPLKGLRRPCELCRPIIIG